MDRAGRKKGLRPERRPTPHHTTMAPCQRCSGSAVCLTPLHPEESKIPVFTGFGAMTGGLPFRFPKPLS